MNNVFDQAFALSQAISDKIILSGISKIKSPFQSTINISQTSGLMLLNSYGCLFPEAASLILFDSPRASKRVPVDLYDFTEDGDIEVKSIKIDDPNYKYLLTANILAATRFTSKCISEDGIIAIITTPDVYLVVRGAFEHYLGSDKFLGELVYQSRSGGGADSLHLSVDHETILIFSKNPDLIKKMSLDKNDQELKKYNLEDSISRYTWDTYIRKQARNYYPIKTPDGTILEFDDDGNRISWLWKRDTFLEKYKNGEIKFENRSSGWRIFYKDRLKDVKILRSISLNATVLKDISENSPDDIRGADLLNSKGSAEIKPYTGIKPDYLKPSSFYEFIIKVFNPNNGPVLIPYAEYGSSLYKKDNSFPLQINSKKEYLDLIKWRANINDVEINIDDIDSYTFDEFFQNDKNLNIDLIAQLASIKFNILGSWKNYSSDIIDLVYSMDQDNLLIVLNVINFAKASQISESINSLIKIVNVERLSIFSQYDQNLIEPIFQELPHISEAKFYRVPQVFL